MYTNDGKDVWSLVSDIVHLFGVFRSLCVARDDIIRDAFQFFMCKGNDTLRKILVVIFDTKCGGSTHSPR
jgi:hypothetical protein